jgi:hypothetical protein
METVKLSRFGFTVLSYFKKFWLFFFQFQFSIYSRTPFIRKMVIRIANYPDQLGPSGKFVENSTRLTCLEISGYRIKYSAVLWLLELQIRRGRKVQTQVHTVGSKSRTSNYQCGLYSEKNLIIRIFCICGWLAVPINPDN